MSETITFRCSLEERAGFSRNQDGGVLRLAIPEIEIPHMIGLLACQREVLIVTVEVEPLPDVGGDKLRPIRKSRRLIAAKQQETAHGHPG